MALKVANVGAVKQGRNTMSRSASERGRLGVSIGGCSFSGEWAADARLLGCTRQAGQLSRPITTEITKHERDCWSQIFGQCSGMPSPHRTRFLRRDRHSGTEPLL